jgi:hypothetical protein
MAEKGPRRSVVAFGHSVAGLVHEFRLSMDTQAMAITDEIANNSQIEKELTIALMNNDNKPIRVAEAIKIIWDSFLNLSTKYGKLSNPKIAEIIKTWIGENPFDVDDSSFFYPIGNVFYGQNTKNFYDIIESLIPRPVYEIFPYNAEGKMKIKIRISPFDIEPWGNLNPKGKKIDPVLLKNFSVEQSDDEVYTVFFAYLDGYPIHMDKALRLAAMRLKGMPEVVVDEEKFSIYGFRPLYLSFHGYYKSKEDDTSTGDELVKLNKKLKEWFGNLEKMYSGSITMSTDVSIEMPNAGEKVPFLGGEFYVVSSDHHWNYGGNPETTLMISRGGIYFEEKEEEPKSIKKEHPPDPYIVKTGDTLRKIAVAHGRKSSDWIKIVNATPILLERQRKGDVQDDGSPTIEPGDRINIPWLKPVEEYEVVNETITKVKFRELTNIAKRYHELKDNV